MLVTEQLRPENGETPPSTSQCRITLGSAMRSPTKPFPADLGAWRGAWELQTARIGTIRSASDQIGQSIAGHGRSHQPVLRDSERAGCERAAGPAGVARPKQHFDTLAATPPEV
jgi:hypothetical protein